ncbi:hypothetical protein KSZ_46260 [Dictyobacter formicarum]|uniref:Thiol reductant ABC exporter subunit CydC n=2 Tax=Dictyobacter formicarum TaxID=2778368 RepID=A0ABQ3VKJ3_9CHLR|nr:hypothetical protein KSZ_46260 [Dictyobacter formicarum]
MWIFFGYFGTVFGLIFIVFYVISGVGVPWLAHLLGQRVGREMVGTQAELESHLVDSVQGIADLVAFGQEERQARYIQTLNKKLQKLQMTSAYISGMQGGLSNLLMNMTAWTMLLVAIPRVYQGTLNGIFLAVLVLGALASFEGVITLPAAFQQLGSSLEAARRLFEVVDAKPAVSNPVAPSPTPINQVIKIEHLSFRYAPDEPDVLQDITFTVPQSKCVMVVGPSGSGKSTLAHLLLRFWDYQEGKISVGGFPLQDYQQDDLYKQVSVVEQDTHLFNTSIRENILIARKGASEEELIEAALQAQLHDFVMSLPDGYDTQVGEQGLRLSGGERQRVAIARAFLKDAPILVLDEPTVNLDAITERAVLDALKSLRQQRTTIMVTHRLVEMEMADEILVLQHGKIVERGSHAMLIQNEGLYWRMWRQQRSKTNVSA